MTPQQKSTPPISPLEREGEEVLLHVPSTSSTAMKARKVTPDALAECGERLRSGELVAFPTETVYGLGCHALDPKAIQKVFTAKERPLTDPLIVHVAKTQDALQLWQEQQPTTTNNEDDYNNNISLLEILCQQFWPGPLTLVSRAADHVPSILMANTGYVACRCPLHPLAQELIREAKVPIAAPSANKFGHVSPTRPEHVLDDLGQENVWVLAEADDSEEIKIKNEEEKVTIAATCQVGVESTVAKLEIISKDNNNPEQQQQQTTCTTRLTVLRQGAISVQDLKGCLNKAGRSDVVVSSLSNHAVKETQATVAPGQTIKHYSPRIPSFLISPSLLEKQQQQYNNTETTTTSLLIQKLLEKSIVLDFGNRFSDEQKRVAKQYRDLSPAGDSSEAARNVFDTLRWAERIDDEAQYVIFPQIVASVGGTTSTTQENDALTLALHDRLTRAASGVVLDSVESLQQHIPSL